MKTYIANRVALTAILICALCATGISQTSSLTQQMPVDPQITIGKFPNGLTYYIRANKKP